QGWRRGWRALFVEPGLIRVRLDDEQRHIVVAHRTLHTLALLVSLVTPLIAEGSKLFVVFERAQRLPRLCAGLALRQKPLRERVGRQEEEIAGLRVALRRFNVRPNSLIAGRIARHQERT